MLSAEQQAQLAAPFLPTELEFRPITFNREGTSAIAFAYINPRAVQDRLDTVVPGWSSEITDLTPVASSMYPTKAVIKCAITIDGTTRSAIGEGDINYNLREIKGGYGDKAQSAWMYNINNEGYKSAESDALKRAAVLFGVGRYLYSLPALWIGWETPTGQNKEFGHFTEDPAAKLFDANGNLLASAEAADTKAARKGGRGKKAAQAQAAPAAPAVAAPPTASAVAAGAPVAGDPFVPGGPGGAFNNPPAAPVAAAAPAAPVAAPAAVAAPPAAAAAPAQTTAAPAAAAGAQQANKGISQAQVNWISAVYVNAGQQPPAELTTWSREQASEVIHASIKAGGNTNPITANQAKLIANLCEQLGTELPDWMASVTVPEAMPKIQDLIAATKG